MKKVGYEGVITLCCFLLMFVNVGLASTAFNVFQPYIVDVPGIGATGGSMVLSVRTFTSLVAMLFVDRYYHALDCRVGAFLGCLFTAIGFVVYGLSESLVTFLVGAVLCGLGYGLGGTVCMTIVTNRWYKERVGTAVGVASVGSSVASVLVPVLMVRVIEGMSLEMAFRLEAAVALALGLVIYALMRNRPSDVGALPHGAEAGAVAVVGLASISEETDGEAAGASSTKGSRETAPADDGAGDISPVTHRVLCLAMILVGMVSMAATAYLSVLLKSEGFPGDFAALAISVAGGCMLVSKFASGELMDRIGVPRGSAILFAAELVGLVLCCVSPVGGPVVAMAGSACVGLGLTIGTVGLSLWSIGLSTPATRARTIKRFQVSYALGGFVMNSIPGPLMDLTGTYVTSYVIMLVVLVVAAIIILGVYHRRSALA